MTLQRPSPGMFSMQKIKANICYILVCNRSMTHLKKLRSKLLNSTSSFHSNKSLGSFFKLTYALSFRLSRIPLPSYHVPFLPPEAVQVGLRPRQGPQLAGTCRGLCPSRHRLSSALCCLWPLLHLPGAAQLLPRLLSPFPHCCLSEGFHPHNEWHTVNRQ